MAHAYREARWDDYQIRLGHRLEITAEDGRIIKCTVSAIKARGSYLDVEGDDGESYMGAHALTQWKFYRLRKFRF